MAGSADLGTAVTNLERLFREALNGDKLVNCMVYMEKNPLSVSMWNKVGEVTKKKLVNR